MLKPQCPRCNRLGTMSVIVDCLVISVYCSACNFKGQTKDFQFVTSPMLTFEEWKENHFTT